MAIRRHVILWEQGATHTMSERATKKRKTEQSMDVTVNKKRAIELGLWFDDGNIVIIAQYTPFKVHRVFLIQRSEVFRDMFALPAIPENSNVQVDMMDGVPTVYISDHWKDVSDLLSALYYSRRSVDSNQGFQIKLTDPRCLDSLVLIRTCLL